MIPLSAPAGDNSLTKRALAHGSFRYNKSVRPEGATRLLAVLTAAEASTHCLEPESTEREKKLHEGAASHLTQRTRNWITGQEGKRVSS